MGEIQIRVFIGIGKLRQRESSSFLRVDWQIDDECGSSPDLTLDFDMSAVLLNNLVNDDQTEPRPLMLLTLVFGRVKRIKDVF